MRSILHTVRTFSHVVTGSLDFKLKRREADAWGGPFNGQNGRIEIYKALLATVSPGLIFETGTFHGTTTELFASSGLPVITVEGDARNCSFARARLRRFQNVNVRLGDSRAELRRLLPIHRHLLEPRPLFAYLDAHWNADLPLAEEIEITFSMCPNAVVMIDDFQSPLDDGYGYDDYGPGAALTPSYVAAAVQRHRLAELYPAILSALENGAKRGCVILANAEKWREPLLATRTLRPFNS